MEENQPNQPKQQPQYGNIDGFIDPHLKQPQSANNSEHLSQTPASTVNIPNVPHNPSVASSNPAAKQSKSLLNTTLAGTKPLSEQLPKGAKKKRGKLTKKKIAIRSGLVVLALLLGVGGYLGAKALITLDKVFHGNIASDISAAFSSTPLKGESTGRVNILLAGDSADDPGHGGAQLTDSILILSINTKNHTAFLLSIPRDFWVYVPGLSSYQKINAANEVSNFSAAGYPKGGMGQLEQIVQSDLGIPIDYYGLMDYSAFRDAVDAVGGVTITIKSPDPRGLYDPNTNLNLPNGPVTLSGVKALDLARARGDGYGSYGFPDSDFARTEHQRQLFTAVAEKAKSLGVLTNPVKISNLFDALGNNFQTDLSLQNVLRLIQITKGINVNNVQSNTYSSTLSTPPVTNPILTTYDDPITGVEALIPTDGIGDYGQMQQYYQQLTSNNPVVKEGSSVVILNASQVIGLAGKQQTILQGKGFNVSAIADAYNDYPGTVLVNNVGSSKPNSLKLLQQLYPGTTVTSDTASVEASEAQGYKADFVVILGQNWDNTTSQQ